METDEVSRQQMHKDVSTQHIHEELQKIPFAFSLQNPLLIQLAMLYDLCHEEHLYAVLGHTRVSLCSTLTAKRETLIFYQVPGTGTFSARKSCQYLHLISCSPSKSSTYPQQHLDIKHTGK